MRAFGRRDGVRYSRPRRTHFTVDDTRFGTRFSLQKRLSGAGNHGTNARLPYGTRQLDRLWLSPELNGVQGNKTASRFFLPEAGPLLTDRGTLRLRFGRMSTESLVDPEAVRKLLGFGGPKLVRGMVELFVKNAPVKAAEAREALDCGDTGALRAALHGLKASAGQLGATTVHQACVAGEELASRGDLAACGPHVARLETDLPRVCRELQAVAAAA